MEMFVAAGLGVMHPKVEAPRRTVSVFKAINGYFARRQAELRRAFRRKLKSGVR